jgi:aryl-alcohol dehydrogenase-like predicted oxidoreductase
MADLQVPRRTLGRSGLFCSRLGLAGTYGIDADSTERAYRELGINYFFFGNKGSGLHEGIRRLVKAGERDKLVLHTGPFIPTGANVVRAWEKYARLLGVDCIDVFQVAWVRSRWYTGGKTWPAMLKLKEQGKVKALSISSHDRPLARQLVDELGLDVVMLRYNAAHRGAEREVFESLGDKRPGIVAYTATRWGKLLKPKGALGPMSAAECYRFQLSHPAVDVALCGARNWDELVADVRGVVEGPLPADRMAQVRAFGDAVHG